MKTLFAIIMTLICSSGLFAHALWIETNSLGQKGKTHEVKIFYGEYSEGAPEKVADWYSDVKDFQLWLVTSDNKKVALPVTAADDHFTASFTPGQDGIYYLLVSHDAKELDETTKYQFNTSAAVSVGKNAKENLSANANPLKFSVKGNAVKKPVSINGFYYDSPSDKMNVTVFSPQGWTKEIKGNAEGIAQFVPEWPGTYMIEISRSDKEKGEHHGKEYERVWRCATYLVEVK